MGGDYYWEVHEPCRAAQEKCHTVAKNYGQHACIDSVKIFIRCPVVASIRLQAAIAFESGLGVRHYDAEQASIQPEIRNDDYMRLSKGCGVMFDKLLNHLVHGIINLDVEQCDSEVCVMHLVEAGDISMVVVL